MPDVMHRNQVAPVETKVETMGYHQYLVLNIRNLGELRLNEQEAYAFLKDVLNIVNAQQMLKQYDYWAKVDEIRDGSMLYVGLDDGKD